MLKEGILEEEDRTYYDDILELAGEEKDSLGKRKHTEEEGEGAPEKRAKNGSVKLRGPQAHVGDKFLRVLGLQRRNIAQPITSKQMLLYLLWRNLYWTRFYGLAAFANTLSCGNSMGMIVPFDRLLEYLDIMFVKVEPFLPNNVVPDREWIGKTLYKLSKGPRRILQIHPVINDFTGEKLTKKTTTLFESNLGVSLVDERFCRKFERAFLGDRSEEVNPGIKLLHNRWLFSLLT
jgi:hypothetical protein